MTGPPWWWWSGVSGVVTTLALVVCKAQSESMISDSASPTTRTDTQTTTDGGSDMRMSNRLKVKDLRVRSSVKKLLAATAVAVGVVASTASPASAGKVSFQDFHFVATVDTSRTTAAVTEKVTIAHTGLSLPGVDLIL